MRQCLTSTKWQECRKKAQLNWTEWQILSTSVSIPMLFPSRCCCFCFLCAVEKFLRLDLNITQHRNSLDDRLNREKKHRKIDQIWKKQHLNMLLLLAYSFIFFPSTLLFPSAAIFIYITHSVQFIHEVCYATNQKMLNIFFSHIVFVHV